MRKFFISLLIIASMPAISQTKTEVYAKIEQLLNETTDLYYFDGEENRITISGQVFTGAGVKVSTRLNEHEYVYVKEYGDLDWNKFESYKLVDLKKGNYKLFEVQLNFTTTVHYKEYTSLEDTNVQEGTTKVIKVYISEMFKKDLETLLDSLKK